MHFLVFTFLLVVSALSCGMGAFIICAAISDIKRKRLHWMPMHVIASLGMGLVIYHFVSQLITLVSIGI